MSSRMYNGFVNNLEPASDDAAALTEKQRQAVDLTAAGELLKDVARKVGVSPSTLYRWAETLPVFKREFDVARRVAAEILADSLLEVRDEKKWPDVQRAKVYGDGVRWVLPRRFRQEYGDRVDVEVTQRVDVRVALEHARQRVLLPMRDQAAIEDAEFAELSSTCETSLTDNVSVPAIPALEDVPQPDIFS